MPPMSIMRRISRVFLLTSAVAALGLGQARGEQTLPNILWITSEDNGPHLGCYGDTYAVTPNLDRFAKRSLLYTKASSTALCHQLVIRSVEQHRPKHPVLLW
jgi:hypothetical protein